MNTALPKLTLKDYASDQEVRWCPGCGDYAILKTIQKLMPDLGVAREKQVFVSGIGCSSRFPYYMNTYGFHTIHGRAPAIATGVKLANPDLDVWVITGDGDGFSIGGNHMLHVLRRNVNLQILLFNNEIYGLTKGQYSPTSRPGTRSPSSPEGSLDAPLSPCQVALGAGAGFVARSIDTEAKHLATVVERSHAYPGAAFVEILQNCPIYNDGAFDEVKEKKLAAEHRIELEHGRPLLFGSNQDKGIRLNSLTLQLEVVNLGGAISEADLLVHDETNRVLAQLLAGMSGPDFPVAVGVLYCSNRAEFVSQVQHHLAAVRSRSKADLRALLHSGNTWKVS